MMNEGQRAVTVVLLSLVGACAADASSLESTGASRERTEQTAPLALTVDPSCSPELAPELRRLQSEAANLVWNAASSYMEDPWSELAVRSFGRPDRGQYQRVVDNLWIIALFLDADRGWDRGVRYICHAQGQALCTGATMAYVDENPSSPQVHLCGNLFALTAGLGEYGYELRRAAIIHEYFHFLGMKDHGGYCECALAWAQLDPGFAAMTPDNYQLYITGIAGVPTICDLAPGCSL